MLVFSLAVFSFVDISCRDFSKSPFHTPRPPVGATYTGSTRIPFVGNQEVRLHILSRKQAQLELKGIVTLNDEVSYGVTNGVFTFEFSDYLQNILNKCYCRIQNAHYQNDVARVEIYVSVIRLRRSIVLHRS